MCSNCLPAVEEEIKRRDNMARTRALGGFLKDSRGKDKQRQVLKMHGEKEKFEQSLKMWRVRGCLWFGTLLCTLSVYSTGISDADLICHCLLTMIGSCCWFHHSIDTSDNFPGTAVNDFRVSALDSMGSYLRTSQTCRTSRSRSTATRKKRI